ncbi:MAG: T9SS type A sorting domain-containing protein, partial [Candidatus Cloacimonadales bacterium]
NDFLVATWSELNNYRAKLKVNLINSTGALLLDANGVQLYDSLQAQLVASTTRLANNKTMFTWVQEADAYPRFGSLYAQMLDFTTVDNDNNDSEPLTLNLLQNYPNPFNPETTIAFNVPNSGLVKLEVYNLKGQKVKTLINDNLISGKHSVVWNGRDNNNKHVASGVYFYRLKSDGNSQTNKMILMK